MYNESDISLPILRKSKIYPHIYWHLTEYTCIKNLKKKSVHIKMTYNNILYQISKVCNLLLKFLNSLIYENLVTYKQFLTFEIFDILSNY